MERMPVLGEASFFGQKLHLQEQGFGSQWAQSWLLTVRKAKHPRGMKCLQTTYALKDKTGVRFTAQSSKFPWGRRVAGTGGGDYGAEREGSLQTLPSESSFSLLFGPVSVTRFLSVGHPLHRAEQAFWVTYGISVLLFFFSNKEILRCVLFWGFSHGWRRRNLICFCLVH